MAKDNSRLVAFVLGIMATAATMSTYRAANADYNVEISKGLSRDRRWVTDVWEKGILFSVAVQKMVHTKQSEFQLVQVFDSPNLGRVLMLDEFLQTSDRDEAGYHELIAHVPMSFKRSETPQHAMHETPWLDAVVIGGGDGGSAREILRHPRVRSVTLCEIDPAVIAAAKEFLPSLWRHPYLAKQPLHNDPRLRVMNVDAIKFLRQQYAAGTKYDMIVVDASDPVGPGIELYRPQFYKLLRDVLKPGGAVCIQGGSSVYLKNVLSTVYHGLKAHFPMVKPINCITQLYPGGMWNLVVATTGDDPAIVDPAIVNAIRTPPGEALQWYSAEVHAAALVMPPHATTTLAKSPPSLATIQKEAEDWTIFGEPTR